jgi:hypothetical protein
LLIKSMNTNSDISQKYQIAQTSSKSVNSGGGGGGGKIFRAVINVVYVCSV